MNGDRQRAIYASEARRYDALVTAEDCDGHILPAFERVLPLAGARAVDVGSGTGRVARLLRSAGATVAAADRERAMLAVARERLSEPGTPPVTIAVADVAALPFRSGHFDLACAGWVFGHFPFWSPDSWRTRLGAALDEMTRLLRPGGALVVLDTMGTAVDRPAPPSRALADYYAWLEGERGFRRRTLSTDYGFASAEEAVSLCAFFFGPACAARVRAANRARVPEFTGLWHRLVQR